MRRNGQRDSSGNHAFSGNLLLKALEPHDRDLLSSAVELIEVRRGDILFDAGQSVDHIHFPCDSTVASFTIAMRDGRSAKIATIGREGAVGGVVSQGHLPAFTQATVQIGGAMARIEAQRIQAIKTKSVTFRNLMTRYSDCLLAQILQLVACNALHPIEKRSARWLLTLQDRVGADILPITQDMLAEMLGVQRTYVTRVLQSLQQQGLITVKRGRLEIDERAALERASCECYQQVNAHFLKVLGRMQSAAPTRPASAPAQRPHGGVPSGVSDG